jgi:hypothetical protein
MFFVIKASSEAGVESWVTTPGIESARSLAPRSRADVFASTREAKTAIAGMPAAFHASGIDFSVEPVDRDAWD